MPTPPRRPATHRMDDLRIAEVSGVDYPAHLEDGWLVLKSRQPSKEAIVPEINLDALDDEVRAHIEGLTETVTKATERADTAEAALADATKPAPVETPEEDVLKSLPEPVRKMLDDANARALAAERVALQEQDHRLTTEFVAKARDLSALAIDPTEFGPILKSLAEVDPENAAKVYTVLKAANAAVAETSAFSEAGSTKTGEFSTDAYGEITKIAKARVEADPALSMAEAIGQVAGERPDLYRQHLVESRKEA